MPYLRLHQLKIASMWCAGIEQTARLGVNFYEAVKLSFPTVQLRHPITYSMKG